MRTGKSGKALRCRFVNDVLQHRKRKKDLIRRFPVKWTHREIDCGYCWELCNIGTDEILLEDDKVLDWDEALKVCKKCGRYYDDPEGF